ncbi:MAG: hypothetical protein U0793_07705 [Gemmataceae bacterium]
MKTNGHVNVHEAMRDQEGIQSAMRAAVRDAVRTHKLLGHPIVIWRDGKVVVVPPEEIEVPPEEKNGDAPHP